MPHAYKRPESVLVVVYTTSGWVLLLRRREPADFWQSVTGSLRWGELPRRAAVRELFEETGLRAGGGLIDLRHCASFPIIGPWKNRYAPHARYNREHWFGLPLAGRRGVRLNAAEHGAWRWVPAPEAALGASSWTNRRAIRWLFALNPDDSRARRRLRRAVLEHRDGKPLRPDAALAAGPVNLAPTPPHRRTPDG